jgi:hypothetical protein
MTDFPMRKSMRYPHPLNLKLDDELYADIKLAKDSGYDAPEIARKALKEIFAKLRAQLKSETY